MDKHYPLLRCCHLALLFLALSLGSGCGQTQTGAAPPFAMKFFFDAPPTKDNLTNLPPQARNIIVAKVRISKSGWLGPPDTLGGSRNPPLPKNLFWAQVQLVDVLSGAANTGEQLDVFMAATPTFERYITPSMPAMRAREYFIVTFLDTESEHQLLGLPASKTEFERWEAGL
jgi:hypothetical protein